MTDHPQIRRRPDGSIDTAHYLVQGRAYRAEAARAGAQALGRTARRPLLGLAALVALVPFLGGQS